MQSVVTFHGAVESDNLFQIMAITVGAGQAYCTYKRFVKYKYACVSYNTLRWYGSVKLQKDMQSVVTVHRSIESANLFQMIVYLVHQ